MFTGVSTVFDYLEPTFKNTVCCVDNPGHYITGSTGSNDNYPPVTFLSEAIRSVILIVRHQRGNQSTDLLGLCSPFLRRH